VVEGLEFVTGRGVGRSRDVKGPSAPYVYLYAIYKSWRYLAAPGEVYALAFGRDRGRNGLEVYWLRASKSQAP
jgi:hypothetical protein